MLVRSLGMKTPLPGNGVLGLDSYLSVQTLLRTKNSGNYFSSMAEPIPKVLEHLLQLNVDFQVLICLYEECRCAVSPGAIVRHLQRHHHTLKELRQVLEQYIQGFPSSYDHLTIELPPDGSSPQPGLQVVDGCQCKQCEFKSQNRKATREHMNKEHGRKREKDEALFSVVRLQTWFKGKKERY